jgi:HPt (histidine-containing phosphotransfer) domain-containing protein
MPAVFDREELMDRVDHDWEFLDETVQLLHSDGRRLMAEVKSAVASSNAAALSHSAHTLKGMLGNFCAREALETVRALEAMVKNDDLAQGAAAAAALELQFNRLIAALDEFWRRGRNADPDRRG